MNRHPADPFIHYRLPGAPPITPREMNATAIGLYNGLVYAAVVNAAVIIALGGLMAAGFKIGFDQSVADARASQERDAPRLIRSAAAAQRGTGQ